MKGGPIGLQVAPCRGGRKSCLRSGSTTEARGVLASLDGKILPLYLKVEYYPPLILSIIVLLLNPVSTTSSGQTLQAQADYYNIPRIPNLRWTPSDPLLYDHALWQGLVQ